jgi:hypothetical protein
MDPCSSDAVRYSVDDMIWEELVGSKAAPDIYDYKNLTLIFPPHIINNAPEAIINAAMQYYVNPKQFGDVLKLPPPPTPAQIHDFIEQKYGVFSVSYFITKILIEVQEVHRRSDFLKLNVHLGAYKTLILRSAPENNVELLSACTSTCLILKYHPEALCIDVAEQLFHWVKLINIQHLSLDIRHQLIDVIFYHIDQLVNFQNSDPRRSLSKDLLLLKKLSCPHMPLSEDKRKFILSLTSNEELAERIVGFTIKMGGLDSRVDGGIVQTFPITRNLIYNDIVHVYTILVRSSNSVKCIETEEYKKLIDVFSRSQSENDMINIFRSVNDLTFVLRDFGTKRWLRDVLVLLSEDRVEERSIVHAFLQLRCSQHFTKLIQFKPEIAWGFRDILIKRSKSITRNLCILGMLAWLESKDKFEIDAYNYLKQFHPTIVYYKTLDLQDLFNREFAYVMWKYVSPRVFQLITLSQILYYLYPCFKAGLSLDSHNKLQLKELIITVRDQLNSIISLDHFAIMLVDKMLMYRCLREYLEDTSPESEVFCRVYLIETGLLQSLLIPISQSVLEFESRTDILVILAEMTTRYKIPLRTESVLGIVNIITQTPAFLLNVDECVDFFYSIKILAKKYPEIMNLKLRLSLLEVLIHFENVVYMFSIEQMAKLINVLDFLLENLVDYEPQHKETVQRTYNILTQLQAKIFHFLNRRSLGRV